MKRTRFLFVVTHQNHRNQDPHGCTLQKIDRGHGAWSYMYETGVLLVPLERHERHREIGQKAEAGVTASHVTSYYDHTAVESREVLLRCLVVDGR